VTGDVPGAVVAGGWVGSSHASTPMSAKRPDLANFMDTLLSSRSAEAAVDGVVTGVRFAEDGRPI
jgi:hypothetical protein